MYLLFAAILGTEDQWQNAFSHTAPRLDPSKILLGFIAAEFSAMLPFPSFAGFGLYQGTWSAAFEWLGVPRIAAQHTSVVHHLITQIWGLVAGLAALSLFLWWTVPTGRRSHMSKS